MEFSRREAQISVVLVVGAVALAGLIRSVLHIKGDRPGIEDLSSFNSKSWNEVPFSEFEPEAAEIISAA